MTNGPEATLTWPDDFRLDGGIYAPANIQPFSYCDGEMRESRMLRELLDITDRGTMSTELRAMAVDWPSHYHFSPRRSNLLRPIQMRPGARVLEVGSGCGALTRYLGELKLEVLALEGSAQRARIAAARTADLDNVTVVAANFNDVLFTESFDYVVMVGVLEYAAEYDQGRKPHESLLKHCRELLSPNGNLLLAIENRFGLKYFAGIAEDHTGFPYMGVNAGYSAAGAKTFTYDELRRILQGVGLGAIRILTPNPDYKLVRNVIDYENLPSGARETVAQMAASSTYEDRQILAPPAFSVEQAFSTAARDGLGMQLGNSFLVLAGESRASIDSLTLPGEFAWHYAVERAPGWTKATVLEERADGVYSRQANLDTHSRRNEEGPLTQECVAGRVLDGMSVWLQLVTIVNRAGWEPAGVADLLKPWLESLHKLWVVEPLSNTKLRRVGGLLDATPYNAFVTDDGVVSFFDLEWILEEDAPLVFIILRGILFSFDMLGSCEAPVEGAPLLVGEMAEAITEVLLSGSRDASLYLPIRDDFLEWLASVQAAASGMSVLSSRFVLEELWRKPLPARIRQARVAILEM